ncbi:MAG TPA: thiamine pyrophosphate-dependent enzyme [Candidatus Angelobacter sp.]|nr:thiamine pyrophosphate-dependent enzyme [Candidatus Angelobacter sp.]
MLIADKLKELYITMVKCRMLAERVQSVQPPAHKPRRGFFGLEAMLVGAGAHLLPQDCIALEHSSFVASLIKGAPLQTILAQTPTANNGNAGASLPASAQTANSSITLTMTSVLQLAESMKGSGDVTLMCCTRDPVTLIFESSAMALAATQKLPMVCLVESSFDSRLELPGQPPGPYVGADPAFYPNIPVDGSDVVAVFRVTQEAIRRAREGHGPAVIECITARANAAEQSSAANHVAQDPLKFMEGYLRRKNLWTDQWSRSVVEAFSKELDRAFASVGKPGGLAGEFDNVSSRDGRTDRTVAALPVPTAVTTP